MRLFSKIDDSTCIQCGHNAQKDGKLHLPYMYGKRGNKVFVCANCYEVASKYATVKVNPRTDYQVNSL